MTNGFVDWQKKKNEDEKTLYEENTHDNKNEHLFIKLNHSWIKMHQARSTNQCLLA